MSPLGAMQPLSRALLIAGATAILLATLGALALLVALAGLGRLSGDLDPAAVPIWFWYFRADPEVGRWLRIGGLTAGLLAIALAGAGVSRLRPPLHGAARWAREDELVRAGLRSAEGVVLATKEGRLLTFGEPEHVMLHAPTRTGKGVGVVIPNLLTWPGSVIVLDIKRENWIASAGFRANCGQRVLLFDPFAADGATARFNPLGHIDRRQPTVVLDELQKIATMLLPMGEQSEPFWTLAARTALVGVGAYVAATPDWPFTFGEILRQLTKGEPRTRLLDEIEVRENLGQPLSAGCAAALQDFCRASERTFDSVRQTLTARLSLWLSPNVDWATAASEFDLRSLRTSPISLYLAVSPDNLARAAPLYALVLQLFVDLNTRALPSAAPPSRQVLVVLDEFARLGQAPSIAHGFSFLAGYGIRLLAVLQSPSQLRAIYGQDLADEIIENCGVEVAFAPKSVRLAQALSERLGYRDQPTASVSRPMGLAAGRRSLSISPQRRALMLPQELMNMRPDQALILRAGLPPIRARKIRYYRSPVFKRRLLPPPVVPPRPWRPSGRDHADESRPSTPAKPTSASRNEDKASFMASYIAERDAPRRRSP